MKFRNSQTGKIYQTIPRMEVLAMSMPGRRAYMREILRE